MLEGIGEVAVVVVGAGGHARGHRLVQLRGIQPPLLARIAAEKGFVELATYLIDHHIFAGLDIGYRLGAAGQERCGLFFGCQLQAVQTVQRGYVDRDRHLLLAHLRKHAMLILTPLGKVGEVIHDALRIGVEDVRTITMDQHAGVVMKIVGVAADMRAAVDHQRSLAETGGQPFGQHAAGKPGADDEVIEAAPRVVARATGGQRRGGRRGHCLQDSVSFIRS